MIIIYSKYIILSSFKYTQSFIKCAPSCFQVFLHIRRLVEHLLTLFEALKTKILYPLLVAMAIDDFNIIHKNMQYGS